MPKIIFFFELHYVKVWIRGDFEGKTQHINHQQITLCLFNCTVFEPTPWLLSTPIYIYCVENLRACFSVSAQRMRRKEKAAGYTGFLQTRALCSFMLI